MSEAPEQIWAQQEIAYGWIADGSLGDRPIDEVVSGYVKYTRADLARAQVAMAYEDAAQHVEDYWGTQEIVEEIRELTPDDAKAAFEAALKAERDKIAGLVMILRAYEPETDFEKGFDAACVAVLREIRARAQEGGE